MLREVKINEQLIPIDPFPVFLGIKLDPKLSYTLHLRHITKRIVIKIATINKIKRLKLKNSIYLRLTIFRSMIRSIFDNSFAIYQVSPPSFKKRLQKLQNKILRHVKFFPLRTSIPYIHQSLNVQLIEERMNRLFYGSYRSDKPVEKNTHIDVMDYSSKTSLAIIDHLFVEGYRGLLYLSNRLFELSERYVGTRLSHSIPLVERLVKEYKEGFESRHIEYPTPLSFISLSIG
ncbi:AP-like endonuclease reverse transcriptase [Brachionus plicatilis]|uniref:AP-like endonuclease reverse transcriptase n=1 Tax=Brachionus plicatilis TaxID=10195 RepID=A0A3M7QLR5_BRAPC|nr:AP-like endonuclease reverse transcriptase [Brachionus plicatilis]